MTTPALIETGQYRQDGSCVCLAGATVALVFGIEEPSEGAGPVDLADLSDRFFVQRIHARDGTLLAEVEPTRPDDTTVRFVLTVSPGWLPAGGKAADLTHTIVELMDEAEDEIITRPFSIRGLRSGLPGAQLTVVQGGDRFHVRYVGSKGDSAAQQLKDAGLIESNSGDALAAYLRAPAVEAGEAADAATTAANAAAALANTKAGLADAAASAADTAAALANTKAALADAKAALANTAAGAADTAAALANTKAALANDKAALAQTAADGAIAATAAANLVGLGKMDKTANLSDLASAVAARQNLGLTALPQAQVFWARVRAEAVDLNILAESDSTGSGTDRPIYLTALWIASQALTHTVIYHARNGGNTDWAAGVTLQTGTGARTIHVWNGAVSGTNVEIWEGANRAVMLANAPNVFDLVIINYGHNSGTAVGENEYLAEQQVAVALAMGLVSGGGVVVTLQNPRRDAGGYAQTKRMAAGWRTVALQYGCGVIDVLSAFEALGAAQATYYTDDIHQNAAGSILWAAVMCAALGECKAVPSAPQVINPMLLPRRNRNPNPGFVDWSGELPLRWTFNDCVPTKNPAYALGGLYGLTLTITGPNPRMDCDLSSLVPEWRDQNIAMHVKGWKPSGMDPLAMRASLFTNNGASTPQSTAYQRSASTGAWIDSVTPPFRIPREGGYNSLTARVYLGGAGDVGKQVHVAWVSNHLGSGPNAFDPAWVAGQAITDLFSSTAVGASSGALTVTGNDVEVVGLSTTTYAIYHNLTNLVVGRQYKAAWGTITGPGFTFGTVYIQTGSGPSGGGAILAAAAFSVRTVTFTATAAACVVRLDVNGGTANVAMPDLTITLVDEPVYLALTSGRNDSGTVLDATGGANNFKVAGTVSTSLYLEGEGAQNNAALPKTDAVYFEYVLGDDYVPGTSPVLIVNAHYSGAGTAGTKTIDAFVYELSAAGQTGGVDLCATAVQTLTTAAADYAFSITGTNLKPGERIQIRLVGVMTETANGGAYSVKINSVRLTGV